MGVPHAYPPGCRVKAFMYLLVFKERSRVLPKHNYTKRCIWSLQGCELFIKNANKGISRCKLVHNKGKYL